jgi:hypothetical protein
MTLMMEKEIRVCLCSQLRIILTSFPAKFIFLTPFVGVIHMVLRVVSQPTSARRQ